MLEWCIIITIIVVDIVSSIIIISDIFLFCFSGLLSMTTSNSYFYAAIVAVIAVHVFFIIFIYVVVMEEHRSYPPKQDWFFTGLWAEFPCHVSTVNILNASELLAIFWMKCAFWVERVCLVSKSLWCSVVKELIVNKRHSWNLKSCAEFCPRSILSPML